MATLKQIVPTVADVGRLASEEEQLILCVSFAISSLKSSLETFAEFSFDEVTIDEQEFLDYQSAYLDIYHGARRWKGTTFLY